MKPLQVPDEKIIEIEKLVHEYAQRDDLLRNNYRYWHLYSHEDGYFRKLSSRRWIERYVRIKDKNANIHPLILNPAQRRLMAKILRMIRANKPVRIVILKARQIGFSTLIQAIFFEQLMRRSEVRALVVAHRKDTASHLLEMSHTMRRKLPKENPKLPPWEFKLDSKSRMRIKWQRPFNTEIEITSAEVDEPGHGDTCQLVHNSEVARWSEAQRKVKGIMQICPALPGTMAFDESTANGDTGYFRDNFWRAWEENELPLDSPERTTSWMGMFFPWYEDPGYRWTKTYGVGRTLSDAQIEQIDETLDEEEKMLLKRKYYERHVGWRYVDHDQLLWRRIKIRDDLANSLEDFHEQYPATPEEAFLASGHPAYDQAAIRKLVTECEENPPIWRGEAIERVA